VTDSHIRGSSMLAATGGLSASERNAGNRGRAWSRATTRKPSPERVPGRRGRDVRPAIRSSCSAPHRSKVTKRGVETRSSSDLICNVGSVPYRSLTERVLLTPHAFRTASPGQNLDAMPGRRASFGRFDPNGALCCVRSVAPSVPRATYMSRPRLLSRLRQQL